MAQYVVQRLESFDDIDCNEWNAVLSRSTEYTVFQLYDWNRLVWENHQQDQLVLLVVRTDQGVAVAFAPLFLTERNGRNIIRLITALRGDYADLLLDPACAKEVLREMLAYLWETFPTVTEVLWEKIPPESVLLAHARMVYRKTLISEGAICPSLVFDPDTSHQIDKKKLRSFKRKLQKLGTYQVHHLRKPEAIEPYLDTFFNQHISRWADTPWPSRFLKTKERNFYIGMINTLGAKNMLIFAVLTINEEPIAFLLGFNFRGRFIGYKPTYNIKFSPKYSPGLVLLKECIDYALDKESGCIEFDFSAGNATYKWRFANHARRNHNITMYANGWDYTQARLRTVWSVVKQCLKKLLRRS